MAGAIEGNSREGMVPEAGYERGKWCAAHWSLFQDAAQIAGVRFAAGAI